ncbi:MAG: AAA family ATPase, partial [Deltaproteobacteria bacterium]|nr:AAA family ATPase [Deltaproteobacteria bacterium]
MPAKKLKPKDLRWRCTKEFLRFYRDPQKLSPATGVVGQGRALAALETGLEIRRAGYNIFVAGMIGSGRTTTIRRTLEHLKPTTETVPDRCYVYNFADASQPVLLLFPRGQGRAFRDDMRELIDVLRKDIPKALESPHVQRERELIINRYQREERKLFEAFAERLKADGFALIQIQEGSFIAPTVFPVIGEEAVSIDHLEQLVKDGKMTADERDVKVKRHRELSDELKQVLTKARQLGKEMHQALERLQQ